MIHTLVGKDGFRPRGTGPLYRPARQPCGDDRGFRRGDAAGGRGRSRPVQACGTRAGRDARDHGRGPLGRGEPQLRTEHRAKGAADSGPAAQIADADAAGDRVARCRRRRAADPTGRRKRKPGGDAGAGAFGGAPDFPLCRSADRAGAVAAARVFRAGQIKGRAARPAQIPGGARSRAVCPLGGRAGSCDPRVARPGRSIARRPGARAARPRSRRGDAADPRRDRARPCLRRRSAGVAERGVSRRPE